MLIQNRDIYKYLDKFNVLDIYLETKYEIYAHQIYFNNICIPLYF